MGQSLYLFLEVTNGVFIGIGEKVQDAMFNVILLKMIHQMCAIALNTQTHPITKEDVQFK